MATPEDIFRQQVITLLSRCNNDVPTLIKSITRSLNESGRSDVKAEMDPTGTVVTLAQSPYHALPHHTNFQHTLDMLVADAKKKLTAVVPPKAETQRASSKQPPAQSSAATGNALVSPTTMTAAATSAAASAQLSATAAATRSVLPAPSPTKAKKQKRRCFPKADERQRDDWPTSQYNGNYTLFRYGGSFPDHARYGFYRRYGHAGRGAATSEFHNLPGGQKPDQRTVHVS